MTRNRQVHLVKRPAGPVTLDCFSLVEAEVPPPGDGQVLVRNSLLSLDPYMRGRMGSARSYAPPQPLGEVMVGGTAGEVVESRHPRFRVGDKVVGMLGWQEYGVSDGNGLQRVDTSAVPLSAYLGPAGMPGVTAWYGIHRICRPRAGETVVVTAAAGAVGSVAGQLAKGLGCRVVGIAGGPRKCEHVVSALGLDACVDYKASTHERVLPNQVKEAAPGGVDCLFENVGGRVMDAVMGRMNAFGRVALCGMVAGYEGTPVPISNPSAIVVSRITVQGFIITDHLDIWPEAQRALVPMLSSGAIKHHETVSQGLESAPAAFLGLMRGENLGKQLVRLV